MISFNNKRDKRCSYIGFSIFLFVTCSKRTSCKEIFQIEAFILSHIQRYVFINRNIISFNDFVKSFKPHSFSPYCAGEMINDKLLKSDILLFTQRYGSPISEVL